MTIPRDRTELVANLALRMMSYDQCAEEKLVSVYEGRAEDVISALSAAGLVIVPREATDTMVIAAANYDGETRTGLIHEEAIACWGDMIDSSPYEPPR